MSQDLLDVITDDVEYCITTWWARKNYLI